MPAENAAVRITALIDNINNLGESAERVGAGNSAAAALSAQEATGHCAKNAPADNAEAGTEPTPHATEPLHAEWGFAAFIQFKGYNILLDTGASPLFAENARSLGIDLASAQIGVLSHAHYDHADGMDTFFQINPTARFYLREGAAENCYHYGEDGLPEYIGIKRGTLRAHAGRICFAKGNQEVLPGVWLIPHTTPGLDRIGESVGMFTMEGENAVTEAFAHEQSLVLDAPQGLIIFNSCSHGGVDAIVAEARAAFPGKPVHALVGGLHLYKMEPQDVRALAQRIRSLGIRRVYTGHCTGEEAFAILKEELGETVQQFHSGFIAEL